MDVTLHKEVEVEWRPCLADALAITGKTPSRILGKGLDYELCFVLNTLAFCYSLSARTQLHVLYAATTPSPEQRAEIVTAATKHLLLANSIHDYIIKRATNCSFTSSAVDISSTTQSGLASLALAEATLLAVLKDDPYPALVAQDRNHSDREWMIKAPEIPKVRAHLFARLCLAAAEHAGHAYALFSGSKGNRTNDSIIEYSQNLRRAAKAKACRFFGIDAEISGKTGEAIAWLGGGHKELGFKVKDADGAVNIKGIAKLKKEWTERREDKKVERGGEWGSDAGRLEEARVIEMLEKKWKKFNDTVCAFKTKVCQNPICCSHAEKQWQMNTQVVPSSESLVAKIPSGREIHAPKPYIPPSLDENVLSRMRVPPDDDDARTLVEDSDDSSEETGISKEHPPGAFPGSLVTEEASYY